MKTRLNLLGLACALTAAASLGAAEPDQGRIGVYDSRAVAFAHFWSDARRVERDQLVAAAKAAKADGDEARFKQLSAQLGALSDRSHLQVFSTEPADEAMAALRERGPALRAELGVERFVSKWDAAGLQGIPAEKQIDVTDRLVREFNPDAKRLKTIEQMKAAKPLPLEQAKRMVAEKKL